MMHKMKEMETWNKCTWEYDAGDASSRSEYDAEDDRDRDLKQVQPLKQL